MIGSGRLDDDMVEDDVGHTLHIPTLWFLTKFLFLCNVKL